MSGGEAATGMTLAEQARIARTKGGRRVGRGGVLAAMRGWPFWRDRMMRGLPFWRDRGSLPLRWDFRREPRPSRRPALRKSGRRLREGPPIPPSRQLTHYDRGIKPDWARERCQASVAWLFQLLRSDCSHRRPSPAVPLTWPEGGAGTPSERLVLLGHRRKRSQPAAPHPSKLSEEGVPAPPSLTAASNPPGDGR